MSSGVLPSEQVPARADNRDCAGKADAGNTSRIAWLDMARGISVLLVVSFHASIMSEGLGSEHRVAWLINNAVAPIRMPLFFAISGFFAQGMIGRPWRELLHRRVLTLAHLTLLWALINVVFAVIFDEDGGFQLDESHVLDAVDKLWFLPTLIVYTLIAKLSRRHRTSALVAAVAISLASYSELAAANHYVLNNLLRFGVFFLLGTALTPSRVRAIGENGLPVAALSVGLYAAEYVAKPHLSGALGSAAALIASLTGVLAFCGICAVLQRSGAIRQTLTYFGRRTLAIYVTHPVAMLVLGGTIGPWLALLPSSALVPLLVAVSVVLSLAAQELAGRVGVSWLYGPPGLVARPASRLRSANLPAS